MLGGLRGVQAPCTLPGTGARGSNSSPVLRAGLGQLWPLLTTPLTWAESELLGWLQVCAGVGMPEVCSWVCFPRGAALVCWMENQMFGKPSRARVGYRCYNRVP